MKMKPAFVAILLAISKLPLHAEEAPPIKAMIEMRISQIELDVALKQYEKVATLLSDAKVEVRLIDSGELSEAQVKQKATKIIEKVGRLEEMIQIMRAEIQQKGAMIEDLRKSPAAAEGPGKK